LNPDKIKIEVANPSQTALKRTRRPSKKEQQLSCIRLSSRASLTSSDHPKSTDGSISKFVVPTNASKNSIVSI